MGQAKVSRIGSAAHEEQNIVYVYALSFVLGKWASPKKERGKIYVVQQCILDL